MALLTLKDIDLTLGDRQLLRAVSLVVNDGERIGLLGPNGCGKSTLMRILAGLMLPDAGERTLRRGLSLAYLPQEPELPAELSVHAAVLQGLAARGDVQHALDHVHEALAETDLAPERMQRLLHEQQRLSERLEALGGHDVDHQADAMLMHLGLPDPRPLCGSLSGGERRRVALARLLLGAPDLLLLDEPTNHLDAEVTAWLEAFLLDQGTPLLMVTHDRYFLDRVVDRIVEIDNGGLHSYDGGYRDFLEARAARLEQEAQAESSRLNVLRRESEWMKRGPPARTTKAKARIGRYQDLVADAPPPAASELLFRIPDGPRLGDRVLQLHGVSKSYGERSILRGLDLEIGSGTRVGIVGPNGVGKTTLLKLCQGQLEPDTGTVSTGSTVRFATIDQGRTDLDTDKTVLDEIAGGNDYVVVDGHSMRVETYLEQFLFPGQMKFAHVGKLSGGERNRVLLAKLLCAGGNVLVLDEPTNDLDLMSLRALEEALCAFAGAVLVVSHDRYFLDRVATRIVHLDGSGKARVHEGDLSMLLDKLADERAAAASAALPKKKDPERSEKPKTKKLSTREQKELFELPDRIQAQEQVLAEIDKGLADPAVYTMAGRERFEQLTAQRAALVPAIAQLYERWTELETIAEAARGG